MSSLYDRTAVMDMVQRSKHELRLPIFHRFFDCAGYVLISYVKMYTYGQ